MPQSPSETTDKGIIVFDTKRPIVLTLTRIGVSLLLSLIAVLVLGAYWLGKLNA